MFKSFRVGTIYGIPFRLDVTFLLILPVFAWLLGVQVAGVIPALNDAFGAGIDPDPLTTGVRPYVLGLVAALVLFACVTLHELGHSIAAIYYGYEVESITLWLLGGLAKPAELPKKWTEEFWIAVAGPLVNLAIVAGCAVALVLLPGTDVVVFLLWYLGLLNVGLAVFNMLPAFPLDGGRVLRALLARNRPYLDATRTAASVGKGFAILLGLFGLFTFRPIMVAIAVFVYIAATSETKQMMLDAAFEGLVVEDVMTPTPELETVGVRMPVREFLDITFEQPHSSYPVFDGQGFVGVITLKDVQGRRRSNQTVGDVMTPLEALRTTSPDENLMDAFRTLSESDSERLPVIEDGKLCGLVTRTDLMRAFRVVSARQHEQRDMDGHHRRDPEGRTGTGRRLSRGTSQEHRVEADGSTAPTSYGDGSTPPSSHSDSSVPPNDYGENSTRPNDHGNNSTPPNGHGENPTHPNSQNNHSTRPNGHDNSHEDDTRRKEE